MIKDTNKHPNQASAEPIGALPDEQINSQEDNAINAYLKDLGRQEVRAPQHLNRRILEQIPEVAHNFEVLYWLREFWWRPAIASVAPLAIGIAMGLTFPAEETPMPDNLLFFDTNVYSLTNTTPIDSSNDPNMFYPPQEPKPYE